MKPVAFVLGTLLAATSALAALVSGPPAGEKLAPLRVFAATGPQKDKELDYVDARGDKPTVYVLIREWDRPVARFLKTLDKAVHEDSATTEVVAVWLTAKKDETKQYLPKAQQSLQFESTSLTVFLGDPVGPDGWQVSTDARVTAVVAVRKKVTASFGYGSLNETDVPPVRAALKKALEK